MNNETNRATKTIVEARIIKKDGTIVELGEIATAEQQGLLSRFKNLIKRDDK